MIRRPSDRRLRALNREINELHAVIDRMVTDHAADRRQYEKTIALLMSDLRTAKAGVR
jgi:heme oxygenase